MASELVSETYAVFGGVAYEIGAAGAAEATAAKAALVRAMREAGATEAPCFVQGTETLTVYPAGMFVPSYTASVEAL